MNHAEKVGTVLLSAGGTVLLNIQQISDLLTSLCAIASIGYTIFSFISDKRKNKQENDSNQEEE